MVWGKVGKERAGRQAPDHGTPDIHIVYLSGLKLFDILRRTYATGVRMLFLPS